MTDHASNALAEKRAAAQAAAGSFRAFVLRLHFYVGLFVGPFIFFAALSGLLYVATPQLEDWVYRDQLTTRSAGPSLSLAEQAYAARAHVGEGPTLFAVRPAPGTGQTSRIQFREPEHGPSESRAVFVDPVTGEVKGDHVVYGTSGVLPLRTTIDYLHRNMLLGDVGRLYSELAASWLLVAALSGLLLWWWRPSARLSDVTNERARTRRLHGRIGGAIAVGLVFVGVTGLTWSQHAGGRIAEFRQAVGWITPSVATTLSAAEAGDGGVGEGAHAAHAEHAAPTPVVAGTSDHVAQLDRVEAVTREAGIRSPMIEMQVPAAPDRAWMVREYDRAWPTNADSVAIDPRDMSVIDQTDFRDFPLVAKLIRWGIDLHMGILFGVPNQILLGGIALGLMASIAYGYMIWWQRRPAPGAPHRTLAATWTRLALWQRVAVLAVGAALAFAMPVLGVSLAAFCLIDLARWRLAR